MRDVKPLQKGLAYLSKNLKIDESAYFREGSSSHGRKVGIVAEHLRC